MTTPSKDKDDEITPQPAYIEGRVSYQRAGQVRRALAERANAVGQGNTERIKATDKELAALGYTLEDEKPEVRRDKPPEGRTAPSERTVTSSTSTSAASSSPASIPSPSDAPDSAAKPKAPDSPTGKFGGSKS